jgi:hypothetical protein
MYAYSKAALGEAAGYVDEMDKVAPDSRCMHALVSASTVAYARPFTSAYFSAKERRIPLENVEPPSRLKQLHSRFLAARHRSVGHKDAQIHTDELPRNVLVMKRGKSDASFLPIGVHELKPWARQEIKQLCAYFIDHCNQRLGPLMERYRSEIFRRDPGTYRLVLCDPPDEWLEPFDDFWVTPLESE